MTVGIIPTLSATTARLNDPRELRPNASTGSPTGRRPNRRLPVFSAMPLHYRFGMTGLIRRSPKSGQPALSPRRRAKGADSAYADRFGRPVGENNYRCCAKSAYGRSQENGVVHGSVPRAGDLTIAGFIPAKPIQRVSRKTYGRPPRGSCPLQAGEACLNHAATRSKGSG